mmetsp:Transcript_11556/g.30765  ORF Transcript_11556/g.30765 Transcript_11556/m.30765 type:complete len:546 (-) Transcript_11556:1775-3412(-)
MERPFPPLGDGDREKRKRGHRRPVRSPDRRRRENMGAPVSRTPLPVVRYARRVSESPHAQCSLDLRTHLGDSSGPPVHCCCRCRCFLPSSCRPGVVGPRRESHPRVPPQAISATQRARAGPLLSGDARSRTQAGSLSPLRAVAGTGGVPPAEYVAFQAGGQAHLGMAEAEVARRGRGVHDDLHPAHVPGRLSAVGAAVHVGAVRGPATVLPGGHESAPARGRDPARAVSPGVSTGVSSPHRSHVPVLAATPPERRPRIRLPAAFHPCVGRDESGGLRAAGAHPLGTHQHRCGKQEPHSLPDQRGRAQVDRGLSVPPLSRHVRVPALSQRDPTRPCDRVPDGGGGVVALHPSEARTGQGTGLERQVYPVHGEPRSRCQVHHRPLRLPGHLRDVVPQGLRDVEDPRHRGGQAAHAVRGARKQGKGLLPPPGPLRRRGDSHAPGEPEPPHGGGERDDGGSRGPPVLGPADLSGAQRSQVEEGEPPRVERTPAPAHDERLFRHVPRLQPGRGRVEGRGDAQEGGLRFSGSLVLPPRQNRRAHSLSVFRG